MQLQASTRKSELLADSPADPTPSASGELRLGKSRAQKELEAWQAFGMKSAHTSARPSRCASGLKVLDDFFEGGLPYGAVTEWGLPFGRGGRELLLAWLASLTKPLASASSVTNTVHDQRHIISSAQQAGEWALWVCGRQQLKVYPPAWLARGVSLDRMRFAYTAHPLADLKPVFMEPFFRIIVLDVPRFFTDDDCAFVTRQARLNKQVVCLLRDYFLSSGQGSVWARIRVNAWYEGDSQLYRLQAIRGLSPRQVAVEETKLHRTFDQKEQEGQEQWGIT